MMLAFLNTQAEHHPVAHKGTTVSLHLRTAAAHPAHVQSPGSLKLARILWLEKTHADRAPCGLTSERSKVGGHKTSLPCEARLAQPLISSICMCLFQPKGSGEFQSP